MQTIGSLKSDRITTITNTTWTEYIRLDLPSKKISYRNGVITIVSPGRNHEMIGDYIRAIIWAYCRSHAKPLFSYNSTTLREESKEGKEPDVAYCFDTDKNKPDLAVEINLTSGSIDDLTKYQYLKISEVWLWQNGQINIFVLDGDAGNYFSSLNSLHLQDLTGNRISDLVNNCFGKSILSIEEYFSSETET